LTRLKEHNYKHTSYNLFLSNLALKKENNLITYIIYIKFSRSNTSLHITDFSGTLKFSCLAGNLSFKGRDKKARNPVLKAVIKVIRKKFKMLQHKPVALHLKNVGRKKRYIIKKLENELSIQIIKCFSLYPYNGCRKKKIRRRKFKKERLQRNG
jgi:ribosomal protein S11